uniref:Glycosyl transferase n=1 Tax=uncultured microorganism TaxID=358574 RepID=K0J796_9ZZZZ|nr:glycosyl transferase [uncultured microorganism]
MQAISADPWPWFGPLVGGLCSQLRPGVRFCRVEGGDSRRRRGCGSGCHPFGHGTQPCDRIAPHRRNRRRAFRILWISYRRGQAAPAEPRSWCGIRGSTPLAGHGAERTAVRLSISRISWLATRRVFLAGGPGSGRDHLPGFVTDHIAERHSKPHHYWLTEAISRSPRCRDNVRAGSLRVAWDGGPTWRNGLHSVRHAGPRCRSRAHALEHWKSRACCSHSRLVQHHRLNILIGSHCRPGW